VAIRVECIYENGVLRPVEPIPLKDQTRVTLTFEVPSNRAVDMPNPPEPASPQRAARSIEEIQERWKDVPGSFGDLIIQDRGD